MTFVLLAGCGSHANASSTGSIGASGASGDAAGVVTAGAQSCAQGGLGTTDCGTDKESCSTSLLVTGGTYYRTYDPTDADGGVEVAPDGGPTGEADPATVSSFRLDKYDVTVGRFRQFVSAVLPPDGGAGWMPPAGSGKHTHLNGGQGLVNSGSGTGYEPGWMTSDNSNIAPTSANLVCDPNYGTWTNTAGTQENLPINCVNWLEAYAFCIWDGGFLPSEAEWEYAAAGGDQQREYPWGAAAPGTASQYAIYDCYYPSGSSTCNAVGVQNVAPVGTAASGTGLFGQLDLAGNVWQWNLDWYVTSYSSCTDCADTTASSYRVFRGGSFNLDAPVLVPTVRYYFGPPAYRSSLVGFRCARTP
jgi:formylglycine-generating enzyme required for sulfatase activity